MTDFHDAKDLRRYRARKRKQREYSAAYRAGLKERRAPDRDEIAAAVLAELVMGLAPGGVRGPFVEKVLDRLAGRFDRDASHATLVSIVDRHRSRTSRQN